jgi:hypothetical protein
MGRICQWETPLHCHLPMTPWVSAVSVLVKSAKWLYPGLLLANAPDHTTAFQMWSTWAVFIHTIFKLEKCVWIMESICWSKNHWLPLTKTRRNCQTMPSLKNCFWWRYFCYAYIYRSLPLYWVVLFFYLPPNLGKGGQLPTIQVIKLVWPWVNIFYLV